MYLTNLKSAFYPLIRPSAVYPSASTFYPNPTYAIRVSRVFVVEFRDYDGVLSPS